MVLMGQAKCKQRQQRQKIVCLEILRKTPLDKSPRVFFQCCTEGQNCFSVEQAKRLSDLVQLILFSVQFLPIGKNHLVRMTS